MKLNAAIIEDYLGQVFRLKTYGRKKKELTLDHFEFLVDSHGIFLPDSVYLAFADKLPKKPQFASGTVIICIGGLPPAQYTNGACVCFSIVENVDLFTVANTLQKLYSIFDNWEKALNDGIVSSNAVNKIVQLCEPILNTPIVILNHNFEYLAVSKLPKNNDNFEIWAMGKNESISLSGISAAMEHNSLDLTSRDPYILKVDDTQSLSVNIFDGNMYIGSLTFAYTTRELRESDFALIKFLATYVKKAIVELPKAAEDHVYTLKSALNDLLQGKPCSSTYLSMLSLKDSSSEFIGMVFLLPQKLRKAPVDFLCNLIEASVPDSVAMSYESNIIAVSTVGNTLEEKRIFEKALSSFCAEVQMKAGVSNPFMDLRNARLYVKQASTALEYGLTLSEKDSVFLFSSYIYRYLVTHSTGDFPIETLLPTGLRAIIERDKKYGSEYINTLKAYIDNNLNISKTTEQLYLHRSSLIDRLNRIQKLLNLNLKDPETRYQIRLFLSALEYIEQDVGTVNFNWYF